MIEKEILRDSGQYDAKLVGGLTARQVACGAIGIAISLPVGIILNRIFIPSFSIPIAAALGLPALLCGWYKPYGVPLEKFAAAAIKENFISPAKRKYITELPIKEEPIKELTKKEMRKLEKQRSADLKKYGAMR